jgi:hypothetical protein
MTKVTGYFVKGLLLIKEGCVRERRPTANVVRGLMNKTDRHCVTGAEKWHWPFLFTNTRTLRIDYLR